VISSSGEPIEPAQSKAVEPWWRSVDTSPSRTRSRGPEMTSLPKDVTSPID